MPRAPNERPSRPLSAYNYFFRQERQRLLREENDLVKALGFKGFAKYIGQEWKKIGPQERAQYKDMAANDKARYGLEMIAWQNEQAEFLDRLQDSEESEDQAQNPGEEDSFAQINVEPPNVESLVEMRRPKVQLSPNIRRGTKQYPVQNLFSPTFSAGQNYKPHAQGSSSTTASFQALSMQTLDHRAPYPLFFQQEIGPPVFSHFDQKSSFANMAQEFGDEGIDYLLHVLGPSQDAKHRSGNKTDFDS